MSFWPAGASYGDPEHGLNAAVNRLRETLGDSANEPKYVETVPRRGYRFIARLDPQVVPHEPGLVLDTGATSDSTQNHLRYHDLTIC